MVQEIDHLARRFEVRGYKRGASELRSLGRDLKDRGEIEETLAGETIIHHPLFDYDPEEGLISRNGISAALGPTGRLILKELFTRPNKVIPNEELIKSVWGYPDIADSRERSFFRSQISYLRGRFAKIGVDGMEVIRPAWGVGYYLCDNSVGGEELVFNEQAPERVYKHPEFTYYVDRASVKRRDGSVERLTALENRLLLKLVENKNQVLTFDQLVDAMWKDDFERGGRNVIKTHISHLRSKIHLPGDDRKSIIQSREDLGYSLIDPIIRKLNEESYTSGAGQISNLHRESGQSGEIPQSLAAEPVFHHPLYDYDPGQRQISRDGTLVRLTKTESEIFEFFNNDRNRSIPYNEIIAKVWGYTNFSHRDRGLLRSQISGIRSRLNKLGISGYEIIETVRGTGYSLRDRSSQRPLEVISIEQPPKRIYATGEFKYDPDRASIRRSDGEEFALTASENRLLLKLIANRGEILSIDQSCEAVSAGSNKICTIETIRTLIFNLRNKIHLPGEVRNSIIASRWGIGYVFAGGLPDVKNGDSGNLPV